MLSATRPDYRTNEAGERVQVMQPVHVRRDWFEDGSGTVHFMVRYCSKPFPLDKASSTSVEVSKLDQLPGVIDALLAAVRAGELAGRKVAADQRGSGCCCETSAQIGATGPTRWNRHKNLGHFAYRL